MKYSRPEIEPQGKASILVQNCGAPKAAACDDAAPGPTLSGGAYELDE